jgi:lipoprotein signal peptidase
MRRSLVRTFSLAAALALAAGCNKATSSTTSPTTVTTTTTETFEGTLTKNGGVSFSFIAASSGSVSATLKTVGPDTTVALGVSLGTWNGSSCQLVLSNDNAFVGSVVIGSLSAASNLCVRVYDVGRIATATTVMTFAVDVIHP